MENCKLDLDEAISSIEVYGKSYKETLAEVTFKTNPTEEELRQLKIKIPQSERIITFYLKTMEGNKLHGGVSFPELDSR
jgi:hypothetical protein